MLSTFQNIHQEFYKQFSGANLAKEISFTDYRGQNFNAAFKPALRSADNTVEESRDSYPMILVTPFTPKYREGHRPDEKPYYENARDTNADNVKDTITRVFEPVALVFRYEVNLYAKNDRHLTAMQQWMEKTFQYHEQNFFIFNVGTPANTVWGEEITGDRVAYDFRHVTDPVRTDGVRESMYEFLLYPYVHLKDAVDLPLIQDLNIAINTSVSI